jgi:hypothetical protein
MYKIHGILLRTRQAMFRLKRHQKGEKTRATSQELSILLKQNNTTSVLMYLHLLEPSPEQPVSIVQLSLKTGPAIKETIQGKKAYGTNLSTSINTSN